MRIRYYIDKLIEVTVGNAMRFMDRMTDHMNAISYVLEIIAAAAVAIMLGVVFGLFLRGAV